MSDAFSASILLCGDASWAMFVRELEHRGHRLIAVSTCAEAFASACAEDFDVLLATSTAADGSPLVLPSALGIRRPPLAIVLSRLNERIHDALVPRLGFDRQLTHVVDLVRLENLIRKVTRSRRRSGRVDPTTAGARR